MRLEGLAHAERTPPELAIIRERLIEWYEETLTEPLPKRLTELVEAFNERERCGSRRVPDQKIDRRG